MTNSSPKDITDIISLLSKGEYTPNCATKTHLTHCTGKHDAFKVIEQLDSMSLDESGITLESLESLIKVLCDSNIKLSLSQRSHIIKSHIFFRFKVPTTVIYTIINTLGISPYKAAKPKLSHQFQTPLIQWLIAIVPYAEDNNVFTRSYGVLFHLLEYEYLRENLSQLLAITTRKQHVTEVRVRRLQEVLSKDPGSDGVRTLISLYQEYRPDLVLVHIPKSRHKRLRRGSEEYVEKLRTFRVDKDGAIEGYQGRTPGFGATKGQAISASADFTSSLSLPHAHNIQDAHQLVKKLDKIEPPTSFESTLFDPTGLSLLAFVLKGSDVDFLRFDEWMVNSFEELQFMKTSQQKDFLSMIVNYVEATGDLRSSIVEEFLSNEEVVTAMPHLSDYLWDFISRITLENIDYLTIIGPLYSGLLPKMPDEWCSGYLDALTRVLTNCYRSIKTNDEGSKALIDAFQGAIRPIPTKLKSSQLNRKLALSTCRLIHTLQLAPEYVLDVDDVVLPPPLMYTLIFLDDPIVFSSVCAHLNFAKNIIKNGGNSEKVLHFTNLHNSYVVDICNLIWRNKAFDIPRSSTTAFGMTPEFTSSFTSMLPIFDSHTTFKSLFNLHHSPAFASYSADIVRALEDKDTECSTRHEGPLSLSSAQELIDDPDVKWLSISTAEDVRIEVLKELEKIGYVGVSDLLFNHMKSLLGKR